MESRKTYGELLTKPVLTKEEEKKVIEFEKFITKAKEYAPFTNDFTKEVVQNYEHEIAFLKELKEDQKNENIKRTITNGEKIRTLRSKQEKKQEYLEQKEQEALRLERKKQKMAGYTNASILIFIVCNLGLFLAALLLSIK